MTDDELRALRDAHWTHLQSSITLRPCWVAPYLSLLLDHPLTHEEGLRLIDLINERSDREQHEEVVTRLRDVVRSEHPFNWRRASSL